MSKAKRKMIKIPKSEATANDGLMSGDGINKFGFAELLDGSFVVDPNTENTHPDFFKNKTKDFVFVGKEDLKPTDEIE